MIIYPSNMCKFTLCFHHLCCWLGQQAASAVECIFWGSPEEEENHAKVKSGKGFDETLFFGGGGGGDMLNASVIE